MELRCPRSQGDGVAPAPCACEWRGGRLQGTRTPWDSTLAAGGAELHGRRRLPACFVGKKKWLAAVGSVGVGMQKWLRARERAPIYRHMVGLGFFLVGLLG